MTRVLTLLVVFVVSSVYAEEAQTPSAGFLEFLGEWETSDGQWQDPIEFSELDDTAIQQVEKQQMDVQQTEGQQAESKSVSEEQGNDQ